MPTSEPEPPRSLTFPEHQGPRVWLVTCANGPIGVSLCRELLAHGDCVAAGVPTCDTHDEQEKRHEVVAFLDELNSAMNERQGHDEYDMSEEESGHHESSSSGAASSWRTRLSVIPLDPRSIGQCQAAIAETMQTFGRIDILFSCNSEAILGTVEELSQSPRALSLVRDQFETTFFSTINIIKATLPVFRSARNGHIILLSAVTAHLGTPGLGVYCASQWATEGYCDSLAYEVAPFNIRISIVQPNIEVNVLTHRITSAPPMACYAEENHPAPLSRNILSSLLDKIEGSAEPTIGDQLHSNQVTSVIPPLSRKMRESLVGETVYAIAAIGGHENPPARHIVGVEGVTAVKQKLKTVSEELEDFVESSQMVDVEKPKASPS